MGNAIPDIRRGNIHIARDHRESPLVRKSAPCQHHETHHPPQNIDFPPRFQPGHIVLANEIKKPRTWKSRCHEPHRIHRKRGPRSFRFASIAEKTSLILDGSLEHLATHGRRHRRPIQLVGRDVCGNENNPLKAEFFHRLPRQDEMSMVDGIEASAKQSDVL